MFKLIVFSWLMSTNCFAYIPEYGLIMSRAASQHGKGIYQIEQEITFQKENESYAIKETWLVQNENSLRLTVEGRGVLKGALQGVHVYEGNQRYFIDASGSIKTSRLGEDWLTPFLVFRNSKYARSRLHSMKIAPAESLSDRAPLNVEGTPRYSPVPFVRLARVGGSISYAIGEPPQSDPAPTAWIEQDQFVFRKIRTNSNAVWRADEYMKNGDGFWYPRLQTYQWGSYQVTIQTTSVKPVAKSAALESTFKAKSLVAARDMMKLPENDALKEFFLRFR